MKLAVIMTMAFALVSQGHAGKTLILTNCPTAKGGYIEGNKDYTCTCSRAAGDAGTVTIDDNGGGGGGGGSTAAPTTTTAAAMRMKRDDGNSQSVNITFDATAPHSSNYTCTSDGYDPKIIPGIYAYGPEGNMVTGNVPKTTFKVCPSTKKVTVTVTCTIADTKNIVPSAKLQLSGSKGEKFKETKNDKTGSMETVFSLETTKGLMLSLSCVGVNSVFSSFKSVLELPAITVLASPDTPQIFLNNESIPLDSNKPRSVSVDNGLKIRCKVPGGYPEPSESTLKCGDLHGFPYDDNREIVLIVNRTDEFTSGPCTCTSSNKNWCHSVNSSAELTLETGGGSYGNRIEASGLEIFFGFLTALIISAVRV